MQGIPEIPKDLKELYKTVWEIKQKTILEMAADRGAYICQSQSLNIHIQDVNFGKLTSMHFHAWKLGLKTGFGFGVYAWRKKFSIAHFFDSVAPGFILANGIGRIDFGLQLGVDGHFGLGVRTCRTLVLVYNIKADGVFAAAGIGVAVTNNTVCKRRGIIYKTIVE